MAEKKEKIWTFPHTYKKGKHVRPLKDVVAEAALEEKTKKPVLRRKISTWWRRLIFWIAALLCIPFLLIGGTFLYIISPLAEKPLTKWTENIINEASKPLGLQVKIASLRCFADGKIEIYGLHSYDAKGQWIIIDESIIYPRWSTFVYAGIAALQQSCGMDISSILIEKSQPTLAPLAFDPQHYSTDITTAKILTDKTLHDSLTSHNTTHNNSLPHIQLPQNTHQQQSKDHSSHKPPENIPLTAQSMTDNLLKNTAVTKDKVTIGLSLGTLYGVRMSRLPQLIQQETEENTNFAAPLAFLPSWLAISIGEISLNRFFLGITEKNICITAYIHGQANDAQCRLRGAVLLEAGSLSQWVLPPVQDLPADVRLSWQSLHRDETQAAQAHNLVPGRKIGSQRLLSLVSVDYSKGDLDLRWHYRDTLLAPTVFSAIDHIWSRTRILAHIPAWPPSPQDPLQAQIAGRFGISLLNQNQKVKPSVFSGQIYLDGNKYIVRDMRLLVPAREPNIELTSSFGMSPQEGPGMQLRLNIKDLSRLAHAMGINTKKNPCSGSANLNVHITRGGEYLLWWTKPLPPIQKGRTLFGFNPATTDLSILAQHISSATKTALSVPALFGYSQETDKNNTSRLPHATQEDTALRISTKLEIPSLHIKQGVIKDIFFSIHGSSVDADDAPINTVSGRKQNASQNNPTNNHDSYEDFTSLGLPRGLVGTTYFRAGDLMGMGKGTMKANWFVGGLHNEAKTFQTDIETLDVNFPGITSNADISFAYALPRTIKRWPWVDGTWEVSVQNWRWLNILINSPIRGTNLSLRSTFKSLIDAEGKARQYLNTLVDAEQISAPSFTVKNIRGTAESYHVHALTDSLALTLGPIRNLIEKPADNVPKDFPLLTSKIQLASGRGGSIRWEWGEFDMGVANDAAQFNIHMKGDLNALMQGKFNFRTRVLQVGRAQILTKSK